MNTKELSIVIPCHNEEQAIGQVVTRVHTVLQNNKIDGEIIVVDNASTDKSITEVHKTHVPIRIVKEKRLGYGSAYLTGLQEASGTYLILMDGDLTYDETDIPLFLTTLRNGSDVVMGHRKQSLMKPGAMPWHHKYIGNPFLSFFLRVCTGTRIRDAHCGMRAITRKAYEMLNLHTTGMEFASEFVLEAHRKHMHITEIPITYHPREGTSKLRSFRDGWRHLRFILLYSPGFLFFIPGLILFATGSILMFSLFIGPVHIGDITLLIHPLFFSAAAVIIGYQLMIFAVFARTYAGTHLEHETRYLNWIYKHLSIEKAGTLGLGVTVIGISIFVYIMYTWIQSDFGELSHIHTSVIALTLSVIGIQTIFSSFMLSLLGIKKQ